MSYPHIEWLELYGDGNLHEVAVVKRDAYHNVYFIKLVTLDTIDKRRMVNILRHRNAQNMELYELMSQITLGNGMNALEYFHQLVLVLNPSGQIMKPSQGVVGGARGVIQRQPTEKTAAPKRQAPPTSK